MSISSDQTIHFIIPCHRASKTLDNCLASIFQLNYPRELMRVSVVENGVICQRTKAILQKYPQVSHHFLAQKSRSMARNHLVSQTHETFIAYVDADVVLEENWARHCLDAIVGHGIAAVGCSVYRTGDGLIDRIRRQCSRSFCHHFNTMETFYGLPVLNTAAMLIKRDHLQQVGLLDPGLSRCEDTDLTFRLLSHGLCLASSTRAMAFVEKSDNALCYLTTRPLVIGYYLAKIWRKHHIPIPPPWKTLWPLLKSFFVPSSPQLPGGRGVAAWIIHTATVEIQLTIWLGMLLGKIRFSCNSWPSPSLSSLGKIKFLSDQANLYTLNPNLNVCLRAHDVLIFPRNSLGGVFLTEELAQILKTAIHRRVISEQGIDFFLENQILIKLEAKPQTPPDVPLPLVATAASRHHLKENQDKV